MTDTATLTSRLAEAEAALHQLLVGAKTASASYDGIGSVTYTSADTAQLRAYIAELKSQLGVSGGRVRARRVIFG